MDKMRMESVDMAAQNIEKIAELFPNCVTEILDKEKSTPGKKVYKQGINFKMLKQMLSDYVTEGDEAYELNWVGKKAAIIEANKPIRKTLRPCPEESKDWDTTENLYIEGNNLEVLKLLQESYFGSVKMIYIDPPYNTGNDLIYEDDFIRSQDEEDRQMGMYDENDNRLFKNTDMNGRFHSDWCSMMYSRLLVARNLLSEDGAIYISIDDHELYTLKLLCDEIFGERNFINSISIKMSELSGVKMRHLQRYPKLKETLLIYAKNAKSFSLIVEKKKKSMATLRNYLKYYATIITNKDTESDCAKWHLEPLSQFLEHQNLNLSPQELENWKIQHADQLIYRTNSRTVSNYIKNHPDAPEICAIVNDDGNQIIKWKDKEMLFLSKYIDEYIGDIWTDISTINLNKETGSFVFENGQKPISLLKRIIKSTDVSNQYVLDFFSGSATTADAVMQLNAEDGGRRKFIMVQLPEPCDEKSKPYKAGYQTICEIGKARIRYAGEKLRSADPTAAKGLDVGFRVFHLDDSNMKDVYYAPAETNQQTLMDMLSNVREDRTDLDLLFGCLLDWGLPLSLPYTSEQIDGCTVHTYNGGDLIACFDKDIPANVFKEIANRKPLRAVFRDSSFADSPAKINILEIFKLYMPESEKDIAKRVKVI